jgi:hypothetical protein
MYDQRGKSLLIIKALMKYVQFYRHTTQLMLSEKPKEKQNMTDSKQRVEQG